MWAHRGLKACPCQKIDIWIVIRRDAINRVSTFRTTTKWNGSRQNGTDHDKMERTTTKYNGPRKID